MSGDSYITNPDAQQGESTVRKGSRAPVNIGAKVEPEIDREESAEEGTVPIPDHPGKPADWTIKGGKSPTS